MSDIFDFEEVSSEEYEEEVSVDAKSAKSMPLILSALDRRDFSYYDKFGNSPEERAKNWTSEAYPALRWLSCVGAPDWSEWKRQGRKKGDGKGPPPVGDSELTPYYLIAVNDIANLRFWDLSQHKKLQFLLLACIGQGGDLPKGETHNWIKMPRTKKGRNKKEEILYEYYPNANSLELKLLMDKYSDDTKFTDLARLFGCSDEEIEKILNNQDDSKKNSKKKK